jgi:acyl carrier protein
MNEPMPVAADIHAKVTNVLVKVLVVGEDQVTPTAALQRDLGADSLDLLEIMFLLEQEFGIEIPRGELFPGSMLRIGPELVQDGKLTDKGLAELRSRLPYADLSRFQDDRRLIAVPNLFTVGLVGAYVGWKLDHSTGSDEEPNRASSHCSRQEATLKTNDSPKLTMHEIYEGSPMNT